LRLSLIYVGNFGAGHYRRRTIPSSAAEIPVLSKAWSQLVRIACFRAVSIRPKALPMADGQTIGTRSVPLPLSPQPKHAAAPT